jgi:hypothetical protein
MFLNFSMNLYSPFYLVRFSTQSRTLEKLIRKHFQVMSRDSESAAAGLVSAAAGLSAAAAGAGGRASAAVLENPAAQYFCEKRYIVGKPKRIQSITIALYGMWYPRVRWPKAA